MTGEDSKTLVKCNDFNQSDDLTNLVSGILLHCVALILVFLRLLCSKINSLYM